MSKITNMRNANLFAPPEGISLKVWQGWLKDFAELKKDDAPSLVLTRIVRQMKGYLNALLLSKDTWLRATYKCLDLYWDYLERLHSTDLPEMGCQRSGVCCMSQTPRVSLFEIHRIVEYFTDLPAETQKGILDRMEEVLKSEFTDPRIGSGVACPFLVKDQTGKFACAIRPVRPMICRMAGVTSVMGKTCKVWEVHQSRFPTLPREIVRPYLDLFAYARNNYSERVLNDPTRKQMMLLPAGVYRFLGIRPPKPAQPEVLTAYPHTETYDEELYMKDDGSLLKIAPLERPQTGSE